MRLAPFLGLLLCTATVNAQVTGVSLASGSLMTFDLQTGRVLDEVPVGVEGLTASSLTTAPDGRYFASTGSGLYSIDPRSGDAIHVGPLDSGSIAFGPTGVLYRSRQRQLATVDPKTATVTPLFELPFWAQALAGNDAELWAVELRAGITCHLHRIDPEAQTTDEVANDIPCGNVDAEALRDGTILVLDRFEQNLLFSEFSAYVVEPFSGHRSLVGTWWQIFHGPMPSGLTAVRGSISPIPIPTSSHFALATLVLALAWLGWQRL